MSGYGAAAAAGTGIVGGLLDSWAHMRGVEMTNDLNQAMAREQRRWNVEQWNRVNAYNHPQMQMARLAEAGLNPKLIYNTGARSAVGTAGDVKGYDRAEARNVLEGFNAFRNIVNNVNLAAQTNNLEAQTQVNEQEAALKSIQAVNSMVDANRKMFDLGVAKELRQTSIQAATANAASALNKARQSSVDLRVSQSTSDPRIKRAEVELKIAMSTLRGQQLRNRIAEIEKNLNEQGISKSDNVIFRLMLQNPFMRSMIESSGIDKLKF